MALNKNIFLLLGLGAAGYAAYRAFSLNKASELFSYSVSNLHIRNFTGMSFKLLGSFLIENPTRQKIKFDGFAGNLFYGSTNLGKIYTDHKTTPTIEPTSTSRIPFSSTVSVSSSIDFLLITAKNKGKLKKPFTIKGVLYIGGVQVPVESTISLA